MGMRKRSVPLFVLVLAALSACYSSSPGRVSEGAFEASDKNPDTCTPASGECVSKYHQAPPNYTPSDTLRCPHPEDACWVKLAGEEK
jgi:hypothetical protein